MEIIPATRMEMRDPRHRACEIAATKTLGHGLTARHSFSSKPDGGYTDYHHKMTSYANILSGPAEVLKPGVSPRVFREPEEEEDSVFNYTETASDRVGIGALTEKLARERLAIIGLGGTGSYVLDLVAKTPVREIRLFDDDEFLQHNAFRSPGAPTLGELREAPKKGGVSEGHLFENASRNRCTRSELGCEQHSSAGWRDIRLSMHGCRRGEAADRAASLRRSARRSSMLVWAWSSMMDRWEGILRVTASTPEKRDHVHQGRIPFAGGGKDDVYASNIQVADLNALNAVLAVVKWKKIRGFYRDLEREHHCTYTTDGNALGQRRVRHDAVQAP